MDWRAFVPPTHSFIPETITSWPVLYRRMPTIIVATDTERVAVEADRTEWTHDGTLLCYYDGTEIAEFPSALWAVREDNLE